VEEIRATARTNESNKELRRQGWVPAIVYGREVNNLQVQVDGKELDQVLRNQPTNIPFKLNVDGKEYNVMVYELQRHPVMGNVLHADFKQINMNERVHTSVPVIMHGHSESGSVPTLVRHSVEVACLPRAIPESFVVDVTGLEVGDVVLVKDLQIPANIDVGLDEMEVVVSILPSKERSNEAVEATEEAEAVANKAAEPVE